MELAKKNAEADHLIHVVGVETEKCTQEKAQAEVEKVKVAEINVTVTAKQIDCERDLKKAEPALFAAQEALNTLNKVRIHYIHNMIKKLIETLIILRHEYVSGKPD